VQSNYPLRDDQLEKFFYLTLLRSSYIYNNRAHRIHPWEVSIFSDISYMISPNSVNGP
jgi:hypothetical protein